MESVGKCTTAAPANILDVVIKENAPVVIFLWNNVVLRGRVLNSDNFMNIKMTDVSVECLRTDPKQDAAADRQIKLDFCFIRGNSIRKIDLSATKTLEAKLAH